MDKKKIIIGIDPGFSGAIAELTLDGKFISVVDMPVIAGEKKELHATAIREILRRASHVFIEKAQPMPKQGISSTSRYVGSFKLIEGICVGLGIPRTVVLPQVWKKAMLNSMRKDKGASILRAEQLFPEADFSRKKDHGKADALLIAEYGRRSL